MIGNIRCYWISTKTGLPNITIGPTWMFTVPIIFSVMLMLYCFVNGFYYMGKMPYIYKFLGYLLIVLNLYCYFKTLCSDSGIPKELYERNGFSASSGQDTETGNSTNLSSLSERSSSFKDISLEGTTYHAPESQIESRIDYSSLKICQSC